MRLYAFGTRRSRLPGSPVSRRYRVGAHYAVRARYFAQVRIRTAAGPCELPVPPSDPTTHFFVLGRGPRSPPLCTLTIGGP
eukprot:2297418-Rhodomonas_salina.1